MSPADEPRPLWEVAIPVPLRRLFTYTLPPELGPPCPGRRVLVPFRGRRVTGYLVGPTAARPAFTVRDALAFLDDQPVFSGELLGFLLEAAAHYLAAPGEVLRGALPTGVDVHERHGRLETARVQVQRQRMVRATPLAAAAVEVLATRSPKRAAILARIVDLGATPVRELMTLASDVNGQLRRLVADGLVEPFDEERAPDPFFAGPTERDEPPRLNGEQADAVAAVEARLTAGGYAGYLLQGVTGSGKTEVYLRAIARARDLGRGALVLVPEINLTPQLVQRYRARFGNELAVWHSQLTEREKFDEWQRLLGGDVRVAIGVRSAVFAPVRDLGIIIVDEEHDGSFKQERGFTYHARDLALLRASRAHAVAVLGSATPSLESRRNAELGKLTRLVLSRRATDRPMPRVEIVDLRVHRGGPQGQSLISLPLYHAIAHTLAHEEQAILFLNRRGFAPSLVCAGCGEVVGCRSCAVALTLHRRPAGLVCHYCGERRPVPAACPACGGGELTAVGAGTQKAEEIIAALFPAARIARLDRDVVSGRSAELILDRLRRGELDILVGTQMVTKGHDFPRVTLVGVLMADTGLHVPDFRAAERTFQLLTQVAGRAGRAERSGRALIQTYSPDHPALVAAAGHDVERFAAGELASRRELGYPPFGRLCAIRLSSTDHARVVAHAARLAAGLREVDARLGLGLTVLGPSPAPLAFLQDRHRHRILLRASRHEPLRRALEERWEDIESPPGDLRVGVDIDPVSML